MKDNEEIQKLMARVEAKKLYNQTASVQITYEKNDGKRITKSAGYIPVKRQIEILQDTGKKLEMLREGTYDYQDDNYSLDVHDPTRRLNFDLADASEIRRQTDKEIKKQQRQRYLDHVARKAALREEQKIDTPVSMGDNINENELSPEPEKKGGKK